MDGLLSILGISFALAGMRIGVVNPNSPSPKFAVDAAHSWLIPVDKFDLGAELIAKAGFGYARERINWAEVEPARGVYNWGKYDLSANAAKANGIQVCQVFHNIPGWARSDGAGNRYPDDLRDVYNFCRAAAIHYKGKVQAWEVWNEADIREFSPETGDANAAFLKAAYLGFKAGDPNVKVAQGSMATSAGIFEEALFKNDSARYFDIFNYHIYDKPSNYPARAQGHFNMMDRYRVPKVPVWITEAGIALKAVSNTLTDTDRQKQAEFVPKAYVTSLASMTDRHFFFVFPHYIENGTEFGAFDAQMKPYPSYYAFTTLTKQMGKATYLGGVKLDGRADVKAFLFDNGTDNTLVAWTDGVKVNSPTPPGMKGASIYDCVGTAVGKVGDTLDLSETPIYLRLPKGSVVADGKPLASRHEFGRSQKPSKTIVRVVAPEGVCCKEIEGYRFKGGQNVVLKVETYNFSAKPVVAHVTVKAPYGWKVLPDTFNVQIGAMGRETKLVSVTAGAGNGLTRQTLQFDMNDNTGNRGFAVLDVQLDPLTLKPSARLSLKLTGSEKWSSNMSDNGTMTVAGDNDNELTFEATFTKPGDRWMYPTVSFAAPRDWSAYEAIELETRIDPDEPGTIARLMLTESSGAAYLTGASFKSGADWTRCVIPFYTLAAAAFAVTDPNGKLDLDKITSLRIGCNTAKDHVVIKVRNIALVKYGH